MKARETAAPLVKFSLFAVVTLLATALLAATIVNVGFTPSHSYRAVFRDVTGLETGDDVRVAGVRVGEVEEIGIEDRTRALVTFRVTGERPLLRSTAAHVRYRNLVGQRYIALVPGPGGGERLPPGARIPVSRTKPALDLNALLNGFKPLFAALSPKDVNKLAYEIIRTFQGEGGTVNSLLSHTASLTTTLADRDRLIGSVIDNLNAVLGTLDERSGRFSQLIEQLQRVISGLSADRKAIGDSLVSIADLTGATSGLIGESRPALKQDVSELSELAGTLNDNEKEVEGVVQRLPGKLNKLIATGSYGSWFNFYLCDFDGRVVLPTGEVITPDYHVDRARCD